MKILKEKNQTWTALIAVFLILIILLSLVFLALDSDHHCDGEGCPICLCIQQILSRTQATGLEFAVSTFLLVADESLTQMGWNDNINEPYRTPASDRVRLNN